MQLTVYYLDVNRNIVWTEYILTIILIKFKQICHSSSSDLCAQVFQIFDWEEINFLFDLTRNLFVIFWQQKNKKLNIDSENCDAKNMSIKNVWSNPHFSNSIETSLAAKPLGKESLGLVVMGADSFARSRVFESWHLILFKLPPLISGKNLQLMFEKMEYNEDHSVQKVFCEMERDKKIIWLKVCRWRNLLPK